MVWLYRCLLALNSPSQKALSMATSFAADDLVLKAVSTEISAFWDAANGSGIEYNTRLHADRGFERT